MYHRHTYILMQIISAETHRITGERMNGSGRNYHGYQYPHDYCRNSDCNRCDPRHGDKDCEPVGTGGGPLPRKIYRNPWPRVIYYCPVPEPGCVHDRSPGHHYFVHGRADPDKRHGPGKCGRRLILAGDRCREGRARSEGLPGLHLPGIADRAPGRDRQDHPCRYAHRQGSDRCRTPAADREPGKRVGHQDPVR